MQKVVFVLFHNFLVKRFCLQIRTTNNRPTHNSKACKTIKTKVTSYGSVYQKHAHMLHVEGLVLFRNKNRLLGERHCVESHGTTINIACFAHTDVAFSRIDFSGR